MNALKTITPSKARTNGATPHEPAPVVIPKINLQVAQITLVGDSSLICHNWDAKAVQEMLDKQTGKAKAAKEHKDPEKCFRASLYEHPEGGYGFPVVAFKSAAVDACSHVDGVTKVEARGAFHIQGEMAKIEGEPTMRKDMVRIGMGTADIRFRGEFKQWQTTLTVRYNANVLSLEQIVNLFQTAGFAIGVGEWRPQKDGSHGMFHVA